MIEMLLVLQLTAANHALDQGDAQATFVYVQEPPSGHERILIAAMLASAAADLSLTTYCMGAQTCTEANPALSWSARRGPVAFVLTKIAFTALTVWLVERLHDRGHPRLAAVIAWSATGLWTTAAIKAARR